MSKTATLIVDRLIELPAEIEQEERAVTKATLARMTAERELEDAKAGALLATNAEGFPLVNGKNAEQREAQVVEMTRSARSALLHSQQVERTAVCRLHRLQNELAALRACTRILGTED